jgi:hypothetical protein
VTRSPPGIDGGGIHGDRAHVFAPGTVVTLDAVGRRNVSAGASWDFDHWEGGCPGSCTMNAAHTTRAVFARTPGDLH